MASWDALQHFHFLRPWWFAGVLPFVALLLLQLRRRDVLARWKTVIADHLLPNMVVERDGSSWLGPIGAMGLVILLLFVALAGPSWEKRSSPFSEDRAALVIALDVSDSMDQNDIQPSRLQRAKQKIMDLLLLRGDSYTGLIAYAGTAHTVIPLSNDRQVISHFLDAMSTRMMPRPGKVPEAILPVADRLLQEVDVPVTLLVVGDGATDNAVSVFEEYFKESPHQLVVWGVGLTQDQLDAQAVGSYSASTLAMQESMLKRMASVSNGSYQALTVDKTDVERVYRRVKNHFMLTEDDNRPWVDAGYVLVFPLMLCFLMWFRKGWTLQW